MEDKKSENPWVEAAAVVLAATVVGLGIGVFFGFVFLCIRWSLGAFGFDLSINQFIAGLFLLFSTRVVLSYLFHRNK